jgi:hypothetical protein
MNNTIACSACYGSGYGVDGKPCPCGCRPATLPAAPAPTTMEVTRLDVLSLIHTQCHRVYASAIDREDIDTKYMREIEDALRALAARPAPTEAPKEANLDGFDFCAIQNAVRNLEYIEAGSYPSKDHDLDGGFVVANIGHAKKLARAVLPRLKAAEIALNRARQAPDSRDAALELAAALINKKVADYDREHGNTDPDTGTREYPGDGAEWIGQMDELAEEIRALGATGRSLYDEHCASNPDVEHPAWPCLSDTGRSYWNECASKKGGQA